VGTETETAWEQCSADGRGVSRTRRPSHDHDVDEAASHDNWQRGGLLPPAMSHRGLRAHLHAAGPSRSLGAGQLLRYCMAALLGAKPLTLQPLCSPASMMVAKVLMAN
jgi:hypothetical protein